MDVLPAGSDTLGVMKRIRYGMVPVLVCPIRPDTRPVALDSAQTTEDDRARAGHWAEDALTSSHSQICTSANKTCVYPPQEVPLRDRRRAKGLLPGEMQPWSVPKQTHVSSQLGADQALGLGKPSQSSTLAIPAGFPGPWSGVPSSPTGPFEVLPVRMPARSQELYQYFAMQSMRLSLGLTLGKDSLLVSSHNPASFRCMLLLASIHYSWNIGQLARFQPTYLMHKAKSLETVRSTIDSQSRQELLGNLQLVATLSLVEACIGNLAVSQFHLSGLMALRDVWAGHKETRDDRATSELVDRYIILVYGFLYGIRSRLSDVPLPEAKALQFGKLGPSYISLMHSRYHLEADGLSNRLIALRLLPSFVNPALPKAFPEDVDPAVTLPSLRDITTLLDRKNRYIQGVDEYQPEMMWNNGGPTRLLVALSKLHAQTLETQPEGQGPTPSPEPRRDLPGVSYSALSAAIALYLHSVLRTYNAGEPMDQKFHRHILLLVKTEIDAKQGQMCGDYGTRGANFWFWLVMTARCGLDTMEDTEANRELRGKLGRSLETHIQNWARLGHIKLWKDAYEALQDYVWPETTPDAGRMIWLHAMESSNTCLNE